MPKKIKFESAKYSVLIAAKRFKSSKIINNLTWAEFINDLKFENNIKSIRIYFNEEYLDVNMDGFSFYKKSKLENLNYKLVNQEYADNIILNIAKKSFYE